MGNKWYWNERVFEIMCVFGFLFVFFLFLSHGEGESMFLWLWFGCAYLLNICTTTLFWKAVFNRVGGINLFKIFSLFFVGSALFSFWVFRFLLDESLIFVLCFSFVFGTCVSLFFKLCSLVKMPDLI